ncbi:membrane protein [Oceaniserpentilla sp. 4NH20-0058]|uniref:transglycosylase SLT domain-containing protein n=1 Tax=Oceaniserpentilla sp. 4NH20-0058 TaxID=3127660 RepID=UPI00310A433A
MLNKLLLVFVLLSVVACSTSPPKNINNVCEIYDEYYDWYLAADDVYERWRVPQHVTMAFIHQESKFVGDARPPWEWFLWIIPTGRASSAFGYAQALDGTWYEYQKKTENWGADRDDFEDAVDFIGWYNHKSLIRNKINPHDAYSLYLAYHEGQGGFSRQTYKNKPWLLKVARKVEKRSNMYRRQLQNCQKELDDSRFWRSVFG